MKIENMENGNGYKIEVEVAEVMEAREIIKKTGEKIQMQEVLLEDDTGSILFTLWGKDINTLKENEKYLIDGFVKEYNGNMKMSKGKYGSIKKVE